MNLRKFIPLAIPLLIFSCAAPMALDQAGNVRYSQTSSTLITEGQKQFAAYKAAKPVSTNASYRAQVNRVAAKLTRVIQLPNAHWEFVVFDDPTPNAFALPGGKVGVNTGIFKVARNDAQLATVLAHEIGHVTSNHAGQRLQRQQTIGLGAAILGAALGGENAESTQQMAGTVGNLAFGLPFSRQQELEADRIGTIFMARAGYNPNEAVTLWQQFAAYNNARSSQTAAFLRTHPLNETRIASLRQFMPTAMRQYQR
ncbi:MAG: M48 family metallopeptidase [Verrucomicrobiota bacterium JB023]|nr:M48 family metallopeptidase [Verrucomicrobiota bacterium JB023]